MSAIYHDQRRRGMGRCHLVSGKTLARREALSRQLALNLTRGARAGGLSSGLRLGLSKAALAQLTARVVMGAGILGGRFCDFSLEFTEGVRETSHVTDEQLKAAA